MSDYAETKSMSKEVLGLLPIDDVKNSIISNFGPNSPLNGLNFGDIYLSAMNEISGNVSEAIRKSTEVLNITGKVIPITLDKITIAADLSDDTHVTTRKDLLEAINNKIVNINRVYISPTNSRPAPGVLEAIEEAEAIVIAPGSLYTSVLPTLLVKNVVTSIKESKALKIYVSNIMTEPGQTDGFSVADHLNVIKDHIGVDLFDICLVDNGEVVPEYVRKYNKDGAEIVEANSKIIGGARVVEKKLSTIIDERIRHNPQIVAATIIEFICNELKFNDEQNSTEYLLLQSVLKEQKKIQAKKEKDLAKGKVDKTVKKERASKFKEKYSARFDSIKNSNRIKEENRKKQVEKELRTKSAIKDKKTNKKELKKGNDIFGRDKIKKEKISNERVQNEDVLSQISKLNQNKSHLDELRRNDLGTRKSKH